MRTPHLFTMMAVFVAGAFGYALLTPDADGPGLATVDRAPSPSPSASALPPAVYNVDHLLRPERDYLGVALSGVPQDMSRVEKWVERMGHKPNMLTIYESFKDDFAAAEVRKVYEYGALPIVRWEPFDVKLADIAAGKQDAYITEFATAVRRLNLPVALTFAHEMNGYWYSWGTQETKPADFVAAWRHLHGLFERVGATNVIWAWTPNVNNYLQVKLAPLYPGDAYVDWVGVDGYFTQNGEKTFKDLFQPTIKQIRRFTQRPILIVETGSEPGSMRAKAVNELFTSVSKARDIIGFVYFNQKGSGDWVIDSDAPAIATYRTKARTLPFGFPVK